MRKQIVIASAVLLGMLALGWTASGQGPTPRRQGSGEGGPEWGSFGGRGGGQRLATRLMAALENDRVKASLNLTDPQVERLRQVLVDTEKAGVRTRADIAVRGIELRELLRADKPDHEAVIKKVQELSDLRGQMMKEHVEALLAAKSVLTPEQQKKIRAFIERRGAFGGGSERFGARREGFGPRQPEATPRPSAPPARPAEPPVQ